MKSIKTILLGTTLAAGFGLFLGTTNAHAESVYTVKAGDTLSTISQTIKGDNSLIESIASDNHITNVNLIFEGQQLTIGAKSESKQVAPVAQVEEPAVAQTTQAQPVVEATPVQTTPAVTGGSAKEWIAQKESSGSYSATNGKYIGRYQLDASYLNGDYSEANQERVADSYVADRYGSWEAAQSFWMANGWY